MNAIWPAERDAIVSILGIGTAVPEYQVDQSDAGKRLALALQDDPESVRFVRRIFRTCGVDTRYTCEPNLLAAPPHCRYLPDAANRADRPSTAQRMDIYRSQALPLAIEAAHSALTNSLVHPESITHLVTVSCTGQYLPGLDAEVVHHLQLRPTVNRIPITFTGCAAGLKAVNLGRQLAISDRAARVLVVTVELCTIHIQPSRAREDLIAASFFGDGASACVIGRSDDPRLPKIILHRDHTELLPDSSEEMTWRVGDAGFELYLSPHIPRLIGTALRERMVTDLDLTDAELWAVHPGGRAILDTVQETLGLSDEALASSRSILRHYGNMSSATILFVIADMMDKFLASKRQSARGVAMAFGPGLTLEMASLSYVRGDVRGSTVSGGDIR